MNQKIQTCRECNELFSDRVLRFYCFVHEDAHRCKCGTVTDLLICKACAARAKTCEDCKGPFDANTDETWRKKCTVCFKRAKPKEKTCEVCTKVFTPKTLSDRKCSSCNGPAETRACEDCREPFDAKAGETWKRKCLACFKKSKTSERLEDKECEDCRQVFSPKAFYQKKCPPCFSNSRPQKKAKVS
jgi:hypothetical protein